MFDKSIMDIVHFLMEGYYLRIHKTNTADEVFYISHPHGSIFIL